MTTPSHPLPGAWLLIKDTWKIFTSTWNTSVKSSIYFLYIGVVLFLVSLLVHFNPSLGPLEILVTLVSIVFSVWVSTRVYLTMLQLDAGQTPSSPAEDSKKAWKLLLPLLWVSILSALVVLGASLLFILPGIYFGIALYFSSIIRIDQGIRGSQALGASRALVKGRWWATFGRVLAGGIVFGVLMGIISMVLTTIIQAIAGPSIVVASGTGFSSPLALGISQFVQMLLLAAFMPLLAEYQVKLYRALQKTR